MHTYDDLPETSAQEELSDLARTAVEKAHAPRNEYGVGAVVEMADDSRFAGENHELPPTEGDVSASEVAARLSGRPDGLTSEVADIATEMVTEPTNLHAEVVALARARSAGREGVSRVAVATDEFDGRLPCETCRPVLREFAPEDESVEVLAATGLAMGRRFRLDDLGPEVDELEFLPLKERGDLFIERRNEVDDHPYVDVRREDGTPDRLTDVLYETRWRADNARDGAGGDHLGYP